jgi:hypothetical protein
MRTGVAIQTSNYDWDNVFLRMENLFAKAKLIC